MWMSRIRVASLWVSNVRLHKVRSGSIMRVIQGASVVPGHDYLPVPAVLNQFVGVLDGRVEEVGEPS